MNLDSGIRSGAIAGIGSSLVFMLIHDLFISDIWFTIIAMIVAGGLCGLCLGWSYSVFFEVASLKTWVSYNLVYVCTFAILAIASVVVYEPITTMEAVLLANRAPNDLISAALPLTSTFIVFTTLLLGRFYSRTIKEYTALFVTTAILTIFLGLNVSVIGLVSIPTSSFYLIAEMFALILVLALVYVAIFTVLERDDFYKRVEDAGPV